MFKKEKLLILIVIIVFMNYSSLRSLGHPHPEESSNFIQQISAEIKMEKNKTVKIGLVDSGLFIHNEIVQQSLWTNPNEILNGIDDDKNGYIDDYKGWDFIDNDNNIFDNSSNHGTNAILIMREVNPHTVFINVRVLGHYLRVNTTNMVKAINYLVDLKVDIINLPISWNDVPFEVTEALQNAYEKDILIIGASGNEATNTNRINDLAKLDYVIAVGSLTQSNEISVFSQYGDGIELMAPGENITSNHISGTSYACAVVSASVSIIFSESESKNFSNHRIRNILQRTTVDLNETGYDIYSGYGLINTSYSLKISNDEILPEIVIKDNKSIIFDNSLIFKVTIESNEFKFEENPNSNHFLFDLTEIFSNGTILKITAEDIAGNIVEREFLFLVEIVNTTNLEIQFFIISIVCFIVIRKYRSYPL